MATVITNQSSSITLGATLKLLRCPHYSIHMPNLVSQASFRTTDDRNHYLRVWGIYICKTCGGVVTVCGQESNGITFATNYYPQTENVNDILPEKVKAYLQQAIDSTFAPAGSVMLSASAVDAMLKDKGYATGSLYKRIEKAAEEGLLTKEMSTWAHQVRLDANDQRHADENAGMPTVEDAQRAIEFVRTLSEFLYVLPAQVTRGIASTTPDAG